MRRNMQFDLPWFGQELLIFQVLLLFDSWAPYRLLNTQIYITLQSSKPNIELEVGTH